MTSEVLVGADLVLRPAAHDDVETQEFTSDAEEKKLDVDAMWSSQGADGRAIFSDIEIRAHKQMLRKLCDERRENLRNQLASLDSLVPTKSRQMEIGMCYMTTEEDFSEDDIITKELDSIIFPPPEKHVIEQEIPGDARMQSERMRMGSMSMEHLLHRLAVDCNWYEDFRRHNQEELRSLEIEMEVICLQNLLFRLKEKARAVFHNTCELHSTEIAGQRAEEGESFPFASRKLLSKSESNRVPCPSARRQNSGAKAIGLQSNGDVFAPVASTSEPIHRAFSGIGDESKNVELSDRPRPAIFLLPPRNKSIYFNVGDFDGITENSDRAHVEDKIDASPEAEVLHTGSHRKPCAALRCLKFRGRFKISAVLANVFGITPRNAQLGHPGSRVIHPSSPFMAFVELTAAALLIYCAFLVPVQLSFWSSNGLCERLPTFEVDLFVDVFFMFEICVRFFVGTNVKGKYCDDYRTIAWKYSTQTKRFFFDVVTAIPVTWVEEGVLQIVCMNQLGSNPNADGDVGLMRAIKVLRILKFLAIVRFCSKSFKFISKIEAKINLSVSGMRIFQLFFGVWMVLHVCTCCFWRMQTETMSPNQLLVWLETRNINPDSTGEIYVACLYIICTIYTTVGFGDFAGLTFEERVFFVILMFGFTALLGLGMCELQRIYASANSKYQDMEDHMDSVLSFLQQNKVPKKFELQVKNWIRFQYVQRKKDSQATFCQCVDVVALTEIRTAVSIDNGHASTSSATGPSMHNEPGIVLEGVKLEYFAVYVGVLIPQVLLWSKISSLGSLRDRFTAEIVLRMESKFFAAGSAIASHGECADKLMIIVTGRVKIFEPNSKRTGHLLTIGPGGTIGDNAILGDSRWAGFYGVEADFVAEKNCKICVISAKDIKEVIYSSALYIMLRRLLDKYTHHPEDEEVEIEEGNESANKGHNSALESQFSRITNQDIRSNQGATFPPDDSWD